MKMRYIPLIQANLKRFEKLISSKTTTRIIDGSYKSIYKGRSMNFDELREYVPGDEIKDIDWKASARSRKTLVRQYVAEKKHNIMFVFDTNRTMLADSQGLEDKSELAILSAGTLAYMVNRSGDYISAIYATRDSINFMPFKTGLGNIEMILEYYQREVSRGVSTDINKTLEYVIKHFRQRMIVVVVTDIEGIERISETTLRRLLVADDVLFLNISDADFTRDKMFNMDSRSYVPDFFTHDKKLMSRVKQRKDERYARCMDKLKKYGIACSTIDYLDELDVEMMNLLGMHKAEVNNG